MVIESSLFYIRGKTAPVDSTSCHLPGANVAKMLSFEHRTSCLKSSAKFKRTNIFPNEDVNPATQTNRNAKMGELQAARQRGLIVFSLGTKLVTRMKRTTHSSHENVASLGPTERHYIS